MTSDHAQSCRLAHSVRQQKLQRAVPLAASNCVLAGLGLRLKPSHAGDPACQRPFAVFARGVVQDPQRCATAGSAVAPSTASSELHGVACGLQGAAVAVLQVGPRAHDLGRQL